jgi:hypothetical protein
MRAAFHRVCVYCGTEDPMTEIVVMKIVELTRGGELDPERLCIDTLAALASSPVGAAAGSTSASQRNHIDSDQSVQIA